MYIFCQSKIDNTIFMCYTEYIMDDQQPSFDTTILRKAGLTESQAKGYLALIEHGSLSPGELAEKTNETRTNGYMICEKLEKLGLATKKDGRKAVYAPTHPNAVEALAERRRKAVQANEQAVKNNINELITFYYDHAEMPGVRYLEGRDGQAKIYDDIISQNQDMYLIRTPNEKKLFGKEILTNFINNRIRNGIRVQALTPFTDTSNTDPKKDVEQLLERQFMPESSYTAPVEIDIYGSRVGFISYGETLTGVIIDNPHIADAMRQVFDLARRGAAQEFERRPELVARLEQEQQRFEAEALRT